MVQVGEGNGVCPMLGHAGEDDGQSEKASGGEEPVEAKRLAS